MVLAFFEVCEGEFWARVLYWSWSIVVRNGATKCVDLGRERERQEERWIDKNVKVFDLRNSSCTQRSGKLNIGHTGEPPVRGNDSTCKPFRAARAIPRKCAGNRPLASSNLQLVRWYRKRRDYIQITNQRSGRTQVPSLCHHTQRGNTTRPAACVHEAPPFTLTPRQYSAPLYRAARPFSSSMCVRPPRLCVTVRPPRLYRTSQSRPHSGRPHAYRPTRPAAAAAAAATCRRSAEA
jgi:hypothetical protein